MARRNRWPNVWTIFRREVRDQLRDRRTLFMVFALPLLLYPILTFNVYPSSTTTTAKATAVMTALNAMLGRK